jgi:hypothetical protein
MWRRLPQFFRFKRWHPVCSLAEECKLDIGLKARKISADFCILVLTAISLLALIKNPFAASKSRCNSFRQTSTPGHGTSPRFTDSRRLRCASTRTGTLPVRSVAAPRTSASATTCAPAKILSRCCDITLWQSSCPGISVQLQNPFSKHWVQLGAGPACRLHFAATPAPTTSPKSALSTTWIPPVFPSSFRVFSEGMCLVGKNQSSHSASFPVPPACPP